MVPGGDFKVGQFVFTSLALPMHIICSKWRNAIVQGGASSTSRVVPDRPLWPQRRIQ